MEGQGSQQSNQDDAGDHQQYESPGNPEAIPESGSTEQFQISLESYEEVSNKRVPFMETDIEAEYQWKEQEQEPEGPIGKNKQDSLDPCAGWFLLTY
jgi:hypothetical protein